MGTNLSALRGAGIAWGLSVVCYIGLMCSIMMGYETLCAYFVLCMLALLVAFVVCVVRCCEGGVKERGVKDE